MRTHHFDLQPASFTLLCLNITVTSQSHDFSSPNQTSTVEAVGAATQSTRSYTSTAQSHGLGTNPQWEESALLLDANLRRNFGFNPQCHTNKKALRIFPMCVSWIILPTWQAGAAGISGDTRQRTCFACNRHMLLVELLDVGVAWCRGSRTLTSSLQRRKKKPVQTRTKFKLESGDSPTTLLVLLPDLHEQVQRMMGNRWVGGRQLQFSTSVLTPLHCRRWKKEAQRTCCSDLP